MKENSSDDRVTKIKIRSNTLSVAFNEKLRNNILSVIFKLNFGNYILMYNSEKNVKMQKQHMLRVVLVKHTETRL